MPKSVVSALEVAVLEILAVSGLLALAVLSQAFEDTLRGAAIIDANGTQIATAMPDVCYQLIHLVVWKLDDLVFAC